MENIAASAKRFKAEVDKVVKDAIWCPVCNCPMTEAGVCKACAEAKEKAKEEELEKRERDIKRLGGLRAYEDFTLEKMDSKFYNVARALEIAKLSKNLYVWGSRGTGKTHFATALIRRKEHGLIVKPQNMLRHLRDKFLDVKKETEGLAFFVNHKMLCIDDLGSEQLTPHTRSLLYEVIDGRWMAKRGGLVITSNYNLEDLSAKLENDRVASRIAGMCRVVRLVGDDRRVS